MRNSIKIFFQVWVEIFLLPYIFFKAVKSRFSLKKIDVGLGPQPLINNIYHKKSLELYGYTAETFVVNPFYITENFDIIIAHQYNTNSLLGQLKSFLLLIDLAFKYKILYFYFYGGPLGVSSKFLWKIEPFLYKLANVKTLVMPYGSDIQDMSRSQNLYFKHTLNIDYKMHKYNRKNTENRIDFWINNGTHIISGCEWVDYMHAWDTLLLAHFSIDIDNVTDLDIKEPTGSFKIFHAPNHREIKGSKHLIKAVDELLKDAYHIELIMLSKVSNQKILDTIKSVDMVVDQFVIGWYAMFAIEAMALGKPVMCYLREDLIDLYTKAELLEKDELPIINTSIINIKEQIIWAYNNREELLSIGNQSKEYVHKHHSIKYIGKIFDRINKEILEKR